MVSAPLGELKAAAKKAEGRLNDAFVAAIAGGLARYHERRGAPVEALRMSMPISIRDADSEVMGGNQFVPARFAVPMNIADPLERMRQVRELVATQRAEPALAFTEAVAGDLEPPAHGYHDAGVRRDAQGHGLRDQQRAGRPDPRVSWPARRWRRTTRSVRCPARRSTPHC